jgi:type VI secretion system secreted protein Hcp
LALDMFLEFTPIQIGVAGIVKISGESQDKAHQGTVALKSFDFGVENRQTIGSATGGAGAGKAAFQTFRVGKNVDSTSPQLLLASAVGAHFPQVNLYLRKAGGAGAAAPGDYLIYRFKMVLVTSVSWAGTSGDDQPQETVEFQFGALQVSYAAQSPTGQLSPTPIVTQWSQVTNTAEFVVPGVP